ncbi:MAG TPA: MFS transporter [Acidobacteriota bacterium]|nr:MFS transporter [Acidobacteriota bacterium]
MATNFPPAPRRAVISWCLYDFANSIYAAVIPATVWSAYYAGTIVGEAGLGAQWWGRAISLTMVLVAVSSPFMGAIADFAGRRKRLLAMYTALSVVATAFMATVAPGMILYGFVVSVCAGFGFEGAMVFYNSFLPGLAPPEKQGRLSGAGFAVGYAGSALGLLAVLPLVDRGEFAAAFLVVALWFIVFAIPAFVWLPRDPAARLTVVQAGVAGWRGTRDTAREILRTPVLRRFLAAYLLYIDGVNTVIVFSSIFAAQVLGFSMSELILVYLCVQLSALVGAALWAKPTDVRGPKFVVVVTVIQWIAVVILVYFVQSKTAFFVIAALAGTGLGAIQSASRTFMASLLPRGREGEFFGFYSLCGKGAAVLGPLVFGEVAGLTGGDLRTAALSILVFFVIGGILIATVKAGGPTGMSTPS